MANIPTEQPADKRAGKPARQPTNDICRRLADLRAKTAGPRGKSKFAKQLGISASTYDYYEGNRVPPAEILVRIADVTGADLRWLITGQAGMSSLTAEDHPVLRRAVKLLADVPDAAGPLGAFVDLLIETHKFPAKPAPKAAAAAPAPAGTPQSGLATPPGAPKTPDANADTEAGREDWIPVLGRTAAGVVRFWGGDEDVSGLTTLADLVARWAGQNPRAVRSAVADGPEPDAPTDAQLVTLSAPDDRDAVEFVVAGGVKRRYPDAFALRVDGDSMAPDILSGDVVVLSPSAQAIEGRAAVVQLAGQIGVTCKLFRASAGRVHLVPINGQYEIAAVAADEVEWALQVLARVRSRQAGNGEQGVAGGSRTP